MDRRPLSRTHDRPRTSTPTVGGERPVVGASGSPFASRATDIRQRSATRALSTILVTRPPTPLAVTAGSQTLASMMPQDLRHAYPAYPPSAAVNDPHPTTDAAGTTLLPAFQAENTRVGDYEAGASAGSWSDSLLTLNDTRAPTPRESSEWHLLDHGAGDVPSLEADTGPLSPQTATPIWVGAYGDVAQSQPYNPATDTAYASNFGSYELVDGEAESTGSSSTDESSGSTSTEDSGSWEATDGEYV
jgi:hypothetical protein